MKFNVNLAIVLGLIGAVSGLLNDLGSYRDAMNAAKKAGEPAPAFDFLSTASDMAKGFAIGQAAAVGVSNVG